MDFPEKAHSSFHFLSEEETKIAVSRIQKDRRDVVPTPFTWTEVLKHFLDPKIYGFAAQFFLLVSCCLDSSDEISNSPLVESSFDCSFLFSTDNVGWW